jgi:hypothetical protein
MPRTQRCSSVPSPTKLVSKSHSAGVVRRFALAPIGATGQSSVGEVETPVPESDSSLLNVHSTARSNR